MNKKDNGFLYKKIPLEKIKPLYQPQITQAYYKRMNKIFPYLKTFDLLLPVEKNPLKDEYVLVGRYDLYSFLKKKDHRKEVPCIVEDFTEESSQRLTIMRRLHNNGDSGKSNKQSILKELLLRSLTIIQIAKETGFSKADLNSYLYERVIPQESLKDYTVTSWIADLNYGLTLKEFLYELADLPNENKDRLSKEKCKFLDTFFKRVKRFHLLSSHDQIKVISLALKYFNGDIMGILQKEIDKILQA